MTLEEFLQWFLNQKIASLTLLSGESQWHESVVTFVLCRHEQFQVELVLLRGESTWPGEHRHPDVDSVEVDLNNSVIFTKNGIRRDNPDFQIPITLLSDGSTQLCNCIRLLPTDYHGIVEVKKRGSAILSVQHWLNKVPPSSVGFNWDGTPVSFGHAAQLETIPDVKHVNTRK